MPRRHRAGHSPRRRELRGVMPIEVAEAITASPQEGRKQEALMAERLNPGWAVAWCAYYRVFTAWAMWSSDSIVLHAPETSALAQQMREAELARANVVVPDYPP